MAGGGRAGEPASLGAALTKIMTVPTPEAESGLGRDQGSDGESGRATARAARAPSIAGSSVSYDAARLWDGLPALMARELPFGVTKLLVFVAAQDALLELARRVHRSLRYPPLDLLLSSQVPAARERAVFALAASLASGPSAGTLTLT
jgi:hypothetical protein